MCRADFTVVNQAELSGISLDNLKSTYNRLLRVVDNASCKFVPSISIFFQKRNIGAFPHSDFQNIGMVLGIHDLLKNRMGECPYVSLLKKYRD